jgi:hypothetical protein
MGEKDFPRAGILLNRRTLPSPLWGGSLARAAARRAGWGWRRLTEVNADCIRTYPHPLATYGRSPPSPQGGQESANKKPGITAGLSEIRK